jgi:signal transduction histidine kinase
VLGHDITRQKIQEVERAALFERERAARAEAEAARDELHRRAEFDKQLIGIVSHDLRNPMNAIGIATSLLLKRGQLDEQGVRVVKRIMSSSDRAVRLIQDFLDFTQARVMGRIPMTPKPANIRELARQVFDEVLLTQPSRKGTIVHDGEADGMWDPDRLAQVIGNLLSNAFQHSPPSSTVCLTTRGDQDGVTIDVHNEGTPISPDDLARLFEPFERGTDASASGRSIGLGLYISRQIIEAHGGTIEVRSVEGEGTRFRVSLPRSASADGDALVSSAQSPVSN